MNKQNLSNSGNTFSGCFGKIFGIIGMFLIMAFAKTCGRMMMRSSLNSGTTSSINVESASKEEITSHLYHLIDDMKKQFPQRIDNITTIEDIHMDESFCYYVYSLNDSEIQLPDVDIVKLKQLLLEELKHNSSQAEDLIECLIKTDRGLVYRYNGTTSGVTRDIKLSNDELRDIMK